MKLIKPDDDNSQAFATPMICLNCEENFTLGEMKLGKRYIDPMECPYCRSGNCARNSPQTN